MYKEKQKYDKMTQEELDKFIRDNEEFPCPELNRMDLSGLTLKGPLKLQEPLMLSDCLCDGTTFENIDFGIVYNVNFDNAKIKGVNFKNTVKDVKGKNTTIENTKISKMLDSNFENLNAKETRWGNMGGSIVMENSHLDKCSIPIIDNYTSLKLNGSDINNTSIAVIQEKTVIEANKAKITKGSLRLCSLSDITSFIAKDSKINGLKVSGRAHGMDLESSYIKDVHFTENTYFTRFRFEDKSLPLFYSNSLNLKNATIEMTDNVSTKYGLLDKPIEKSNLEDVTIRIGNTRNEETVRGQMSTEWGNHIEGIKFEQIQKEIAQDIPKEPVKPQGTDYFNKCNAKIRAVKNNAKTNSVALSPEFYGTVSKIYSLHKNNRPIYKSLYDELNRVSPKTKDWRPKAQVDKTQENDKEKDSR